MSNALEQASLIMVPSGYEDGTLGSLKPTDGTGDFTFSRGSDISATRVNADGYIEKGYENLLLQSNSFTTSPWGSTALTITDGQTGYDGTNDAWKIQSVSTANQFVNQNISLSSVCTFSVYAKAGTADFIIIRISGTSNRYAYINLLDGTIGNQSGSPINVNTESVGAGWYRCEITSTDSNGVFIYITDSNGSLAVTNGAYVYIQDAMLNQGLVAYPYKETTTAPVAGGILEDMPRLDYSNGSCPALLLEPSRTNLVEYSEYFGAGWSNNDTTITYNTDISPEGIQNATTIADTSTTDRQQFQYDFSYVAGASYAWSIFVKKDNDESRFPLFFLRVYGAGTDNKISIQINTKTGAKDIVSDDGDVDSDVIDFSDDYWRVVLIANDQDDGNDSVRSFITPAAASVLGGNDVTTTGSIVVYGFQLEQDATYPTSYIPTYGVSQTRLKDKAPFPATFRFGSLGDGESGTMVVKTIVNGLTSINRFNFFSNGGSANWYWNGSILYSQTTGGSRQFNLGSTASSNLGTEVKLCMRKSGNTLSCFFNGDDKGSIDIGSESIRYVNDFSTYFVSQSIVEFEEFPTALSDDECEALTYVPPQP